MFNPWFPPRPISPFYETILTDKILKNCDRENAILSRQVQDLARENIDLRTKIIRMNAEAYAEDLTAGGGRLGPNPELDGKNRGKNGEAMHIGFAREVIADKHKGPDVKAKQKQKQNYVEKIKDKYIGKLYHNTNRVQKKTEEGLTPAKYQSVDRAYSFSNTKTNSPKNKTATIDNFSSMRAKTVQKSQKRLSTEPQRFSFHIADRYETQPMQSPIHSYNIDPKQKQRQDNRQKSQSKNKSKLQVTQKKQEPRFQYLTDKEKQQVLIQRQRQTERLKLLEQQLEQIKKVQEELKKNREIQQRRLYQQQQRQKKRQQDRYRQLNSQKNMSNPKNKGLIQRIQSQVYNQPNPIANTNPNPYRSPSPSPVVVPPVQGNNRTTVQKPPGDNSLRNDSSFQQAQSQPHPSTRPTHIIDTPYIGHNSVRHDNRIYLLNSNTDQSPYRTYSPISKLKSIKRSNDSIEQSNIKIQPRQSLSARKQFINVTSKKGE